MTATDLEEVFAGEVDLAGDVVIELDGGAIRLVVGCQYEVERWVRLVGVVEEKNVVGLEPAGEEGVPKPPDGFADGGDGEQAFEEGHAALSHGKKGGAS